MSTPAAEWPEAEQRIAEVARTRRGRHRDKALEWLLTTVADLLDDDLALALAEAGQEFKVKHSRHSRAQLGPARQALEMVHALADEFAAEVELLCNITVTDAQWTAFLDRHVPRVDARTGRPLERRALTLAERKRGTLDRLYRHDSRAEGRASLYSLARPELLDLLASAERLLEATGDAVTLCPTYGTDVA